MSKYLTKFPVLFTKVTKYFLLNYLKPTFNLTTLQAILGLEIKSISIASWKKEPYFFKLQCKFVYASRKKRKSISCVKIDLNLQQKFFETRARNRKLKPTKKVCSIFEVQICNAKMYNISPCSKIKLFLITDKSTTIFIVLRIETKKLFEIRESIHK